MLESTSGTNKSIEADRVYCITVGIINEAGRRRVGVLLSDEHSVSEHKPLCFHMMSYADATKIISDITQMRDECWPNGDKPDQVSVEEILANFKFAMGEL